MSRTARRTAARTAGAAAAALAALSLLAGPAQATSQPSSLLQCGNGVVEAGLPTVWSQQAFTGSTGTAAHWSVLFHWNAAAGQWETLGWQGQHHSQVESGDDGPGGTGGWAGEWVDATGTRVTAVRWQVAPGDLYAVGHYTSDPVLVGSARGWAAGFAVTPDQQVVCRA